VIVAVAIQNEDWHILGVFEDEQIAIQAMTTVDSPILPDRLGNPRYKHGNNYDWMLVERTLNISEESWDD
jgi:hypothetical protein